MPETHSVAANLHVEMPGVFKRTRRKGRVVQGEPIPDEDAPVYATCPACGAQIPHGSNLQRYVDDPADGVTGQYACSEACADSIADRVLHHDEANPEVAPGVQWIRRA